MVWQSAQRAIKPVATRMVIALPNTGCPQFLFTSVLLDGHVMDDMSELSLTEADFAWITREPYAITQKHYDG